MASKSVKDQDHFSSSDENSDMEKGSSTSTKSTSVKNLKEKSNIFYRESTLADKFMKYVRLTRPDPEYKLIPERTISEKDRSFFKDFESNLKKIENILKTSGDEDVLDTTKKSQKKNKEYKKQIDVLQKSIEAKDEELQQNREYLDQLSQEIVDLKKTIAESRSSRAPASHMGRDSIQDDTFAEFESFHEDSDSSLDKTMTSTKTVKRKSQKSYGHDIEDFINSTPARQIKYEDVAKKCNFKQLTKAFIKLVNSKQAGTREQADKFQSEMHRRSEELEFELTQLRQELAEIQQRTNKESAVDVGLPTGMSEHEQKGSGAVTDLQNKYQDLLSHYEELQQLHEQCSTEKDNYLQMMENISSNETKYTEIIASLENKLKNKDALIHEYRESSDEWEHKYNELTENIGKGYSIPTILQELHSKINNQTQLLEKIIQQDQYPALIPAENQNQVTSRQTQITYATAATRPTKPSMLCSEAAIIIRKRKQSKTTTAQIRNILNQKIKNITELPKICCEQARDRDTLVIKTNSDDSTTTLLQIIEEIQEIKEVADVIYKGNDNKKLIVIGIPSFVQPTEVSTKIKEDLPPGSYVEIHKSLIRDKAMSYQTIIEVDTKTAASLLQKGRLILGFNSCRIAPFRPILRCNNCQRYGHTKLQCRSREVCQYCTKFHISESCPIKNNQRKHRCINCLKSENDCNHPANSNQCPVFKYHLYQRNNSAQKFNYIPSLI